MKSHDANLRPSHLLARWGNTAIRAAMSRSPCSTRRHLVTFGNLVINRHVDVGERGPATGESLLECVSADRLPVEDYGRGKDLVDHVLVLLIPHLFEEAPDDSFVLVLRHARLLLVSNAPDQARRAPADQWHRVHTPLRPPTPESGC
jgi:hypothetical protein